MAKPKMKKVQAYGADFLHWSPDHDPYNAICGYRFTEWEIRSDEDRPKCPNCLRLKGQRQSRKMKKSC